MSYSDSGYTRNFNYGMNFFRRKGPNDYGRIYSEGTNSSLWRPPWGRSALPKLPAALTVRKSPTKSADFPYGNAKQRTDIQLGDWLATSTYPQCNLIPWVADVLLDANNDPNSYGEALVINALRVGFTEGKRIGRTIKMKSFLIKGSLKPGIPAVFGSNMTTGQSGRLRIAVIYDRQFNGALPLWSDIFGYVDTGTNGVPNGQTNNPTLTGLKTDAWAPPNPNNIARFLILRDSMMDCQPFEYAAFTAVQQFQNWVLNSVLLEGNSCSFYKSTGGLETQYRGDTEALSDIISGALFVAVQGDVTPWLAIGPIDAIPVIYRVGARMRFIDAL